MVTESRELWGLLGQRSEKELLPRLPGSGRPKEEGTQKAGSVWEALAMAPITGAGP